MALGGHREELTQELGLRGRVSQLMAHAKGQEILREALRARMRSGG